MASALANGPKIRAATPARIAEAGRLIAKGGLVAIPTETVYGLACNALDQDALARLYEAKGRPKFNPLIVHVKNTAAARRLAVFTPMAERLAKAFWPGPLTLVLSRRPDCAVALLATAGLDSIALRAPSHPVAQRILDAAKVPIAAPSANSSGKLSPTTAEHVDRDLGPKLDLILDGGPCPIGLESTVIDARAEPLRMLRPGAITRGQAEAATGGKIANASPGKIESPGRLERHYSPRTPLRLNAKAAKSGEVMIGFGKVAGDFNLSEEGSLTEAAANLYAALHLADARRAKAIAVAPVPARGLGAAINDRLSRAAGG